MQTKRQIQELLAGAGVTPNRRLGQHFLVDLNLLRLLVESAHIDRRDVVLEVGAGTGSLTEALAEQAGQVVTVELDRTLAGIVEARLAGAGNVQLLNTDVLSGKGSLAPEVTEALTAARTRLGGRLLLVANLPYDVASPVMINLVKGPVVAEAMAVTVQKEVAQRMAATPGGKSYGSLSILLGSAGTVEVLRILKPGVFWPPPGVESAMVRYVRDERKSRRITDMEVLSSVVGLFMGHRRKMLRACARHAPPELGGRELWLDLFDRHAIDPTLRPEELSPDQYVTLANACRQVLMKDDG